MDIVYHYFGMTVAWGGGFLLVLFLIRRLLNQLRSAPLISKHLDSIADQKQIEAITKTKEQRSRNKYY